MTRGCHAHGASHATVAVVRSGPRSVPRRARRHRPAPASRRGPRRGSTAAAIVSSGRPAGRRRPPPSRPAGHARRPRGPRARSSPSGSAGACSPSSTRPPSTPRCGAGYRALAAAAGVPCHAVVVDTPERERRARNRGRPEAVPSARASRASCARWPRPRRRPRRGEGFDGVHRASRRSPSSVVPAALYDAPAAARRQEDDPMTLRFGLQIGRFTWPGGAGRDRPHGSAAIARAAEEAGFSSISVMDHFVQIPGVGREWEDMLESTATLGFLAARDVDGPPRHARHRHHVPQPRPRWPRSSPRSTCCRAAGRSAGSARRGSAASTSCTAGTSRPLAERYELLEDALAAAAADVGQGHAGVRGPHASPSRRRRATRARCRSACRSSSAAPASSARCASSPATPTPATCSASPTAVARKVDVLHRHCEAEGRDPARGHRHQPLGGGDARRRRPARALRRRRRHRRGAHRALPRVRRGRRAGGDRRPPPRRHHGPARGVRAGHRRLRTSAPAV